MDSEFQRLDFGFHAMDSGFHLAERSGFPRAIEKEKMESSERC